jgi:hypothetical protein
MENIRLRNIRLRDVGLKGIKLRIVGLGIFDFEELQLREFSTCGFRLRILRLKNKNINLSVFSV